MYIDLADTGPIIDIEPEDSSVGEATSNLAPYVADIAPPLRRTQLVEQPDYWPRTIGVVDKPADTGQLPPYIQAAMRVRRPAPMPSSWPTSPVPMPQPSLWTRFWHRGVHRSARSRRWIGGGW